MTEVEEYQEKSKGNCFKVITVKKGLCLGVNYDFTTR